MADRMVAVVLKNASTETLNYISASLSHGAWDVEVPVEISPGELGAWTSVSDGFMTGTQGSAQFFIGTDESRIVTLNWDNPFYGGNSFSASAPAPYNIPHQGGIGDIAVVVFAFGP